jgi:hypothetical protein
MTLKHNMTEEGKKNSMENLAGPMKQEDGK